MNVLSKILGDTSSVVVALPQLQNNLTRAAQSFETLLPMVRTSLAANSTHAAAHGLAIRNLEENASTRYKNLIQSVDRIPDFLDQRLAQNIGHHQQELALISNSQVACHLR